MISGVFPFCGMDSVMRHADAPMAAMADSPVIAAVRNAARGGVNRADAPQGRSVRKGIAAGDSGMPLSGAGAAPVTGLSAGRTRLFAGLLCVLLSLAPAGAGAQGPGVWSEDQGGSPPPKVLTGKVSNEAGRPLQGVKVAVKGSAGGVSTGQDGRYRLDVPEGRSVVLVFSFTGMSTQEVEYKGQGTLDVVMKADRQPGSRRITGRVLDERGDPLPGATVMLDGTQAGGSTDVDGRYSIEIPKEGTLKFTFIGMRTETAGTAGKTVINVTMRENSEQLEEVVHTGIYTRNIESFTGSVSTYKTDDLKKIGANNVLRSLSILDPSVIITENNLQGSNPNAKLDFTINGKMNIVDLEQEYETDPNQPLFILDGFETTLETISDLNMDRVESISVLKDAAATAIYGSKAANGVVVVETVKPQQGKLRVNYNGSLTVGWADLDSYDLMNSAQKLEYEKLAGVYATTTSDGGKLNLDENGEIIGESYREEYYRKLELVKEGVDTYWMNEPLRTAYSQSHNLYIDGGDKTFVYGVGLSYNNTMGVMKESSRDVLNGNIRLDYRIRDLSVSNQLTINNTVADNETVPFSRFARMNPFFAKRNENGEVPKYVYRENYGTAYTYIWNPLWDLQQSSYNQNEGVGITDNLQIDWRIWKSLRLRGSLSYSMTKNETKRFVSPNETGEVEKDASVRGSYNKTNATISNYNGRINLTYGEAFGKHTVNVVGGMQFSENSSKSTGLSAQGYMSDEFSNPNFSSGYPDGGKPSSSESKTRSVGYYSNFNYAYDMRYLADFNFTKNGSSQFGIDDPFSTTWSVGVSWNLHNEPFLKNSKVINYLKIRYSYGNPGNQNFDAKLAGSIYSYMTDYSNPFGLNVFVSTWGNNNLKWQKTENHNWGINAQLFNDRLTLSADYSIRKTDPMLVRIDMPLSTGATTVPMNVGATDNRSVSASFTAYIFKRPELNWYISANINHNTTKYYNVGDILKEFNDRGRASESLLRIYDGASLSGLYAVRSAGIDPATGNEIFIKKDGTYTYEWNIDDEVLCGDTNPKATGSINTSLTWKGFSISTAFSYRWGGYTQLSTLLNKVENITSDGLNYNQDVRAFTSRWKQPGDKAKFKRIDDISGNTQMSSRFIAKENTIECSSINVGYRTSTARFLKYVKASSFSANFYMNDIFRISNIKEERGLDYPFERSFTLSIGLGF